MALTNVQLRELYDEVKSYLDQGNIEDAKKRLDDVPLDSSDNLIVEYLQGVCEQELGNYKKAAKRFKYVISMDPGFIGAAEALVHLEDDELSAGQMKYLFELIIAEKPRVSHQVTEFLQNNMDTPVETVMDYDQIHKEDDFAPELKEEHFVDSHLTDASEDNRSGNSAADQEMLEERTRAAMDDPDSLLDPLFNSESEAKVIERAADADPSAEQVENDHLSSAELESLLDDQTADSGQSPEKELITPDEETDIPPDETELKPDDKTGKVPLPDEALEEENIAVNAEVSPEHDTNNSTDKEAETLQERASAEKETVEEQIENITDDDVLENEIKSPEKADETPGKPAAKKAGTASGGPSAGGRVSVEEDKMTGERIVRVETLTMAEIYIKQGLYHEALQILEKLREKADDSSRIDDRITEVNELLQQEKDD